MGRIPLKLWLPLVSALLFNPPVMADELPTSAEYWELIKQTAVRVYKGMDIELEVDTGYTHYFEQGDYYPGNSVSFGVRVPIYSKKDRMKRQGDVTQFLQRGAKLIQQLESAQAKAEIFKKSGEALESVMEQSGVEAIIAYYDQAARIAEERAKIAQYHREIQSLIAPLSNAPGGAKQTKIVR